MGACMAIPRRALPNHRSQSRGVSAPRDPRQKVSIAAVRRCLPARSARVQSMRQRNSETDRERQRELNQTPADTCMRQMNRDRQRETERSQSDTHAQRVAGAHTSSGLRGSPSSYWSVPCGSSQSRTCLPVPSRTTSPCSCQYARRVARSASK
eukprot:COSAG03_NODE_901_length_5420_cov_4.340350_6_plen_153_part_00